MTTTKTAALLAALAVCAGLAACDQGAQEPAAATPPPAEKGPPPPPSPELPMTGAKARQIVGGLPTTCRELASLKMDMLTCDERQNKPADHAALRTELRDLAWNLAQGTPEVATARCGEALAELRSKPKPQVCHDLGVS